MGRYSEMVEHMFVDLGMRGVHYALYKVLQYLLAFYLLIVCFFFFESIFNCPRNQKDRQTVQLGRQMDGYIDSVLTRVIDPITDIIWCAVL